MNISFKYLYKIYKIVNKYIISNANNVQLPSIC